MRTLVLAGMMLGAAGLAWADEPVPRPKAAAATTTTIVTGEPAARPRAAATTTIAATARPQAAGATTTIATGERAPSKRILSEQDGMVEQAHHM